MIDEVYVTLLSVCHDPSVLAADRPIYAFLAGINESEMNLESKVMLRYRINHEFTSQKDDHKSFAWVPSFHTVPVLHKEPS